MGLIGREEAVKQAREAITALAVASCDCPYETERELRDEVVRLRDQLAGAVDPAEIVAWLRGRTGYGTSADDVADAIERHFITERGP